MVPSTRPPLRFLDAPPSGKAPAPAGAVEVVAPRVEPLQPVCGTVLERLRVDPYMYLRLSTGQGELWVALPQRDVRAGERVCAGDLVWMTNFTSTQLERTFPEIHFGREVGRETAKEGPAAKGEEAAPPPADEIGAEGVGVRITSAEFEAAVAGMTPETRRRFVTKRALLDALLGRRLLVFEARRRGLHRRPALAGADEDQLIEALMEQHVAIERGPQASEAETRAFVELERPVFVERLRAGANVRIDEDALVRTRVR